MELLVGDGIRYVLKLCYKSAAKLSNLRFVVSPLYGAVSKLHFYQNSQIWLTKASLETAPLFLHILVINYLYSIISLSKVTFIVTAEQIRMFLQ